MPNSPIRRKPIGGSRKPVIRHKYHPNPRKVEQRLKAHETLLFNTKRVAEQGLPYKYLSTPQRLLANQGKIPFVRTHQHYK